MTSFLNEVKNPVTQRSILRNSEAHLTLHVNAYAVPSATATAWFKSTGTCAEATPSDLRAYARSMDISLTSGLPRSVAA